MLLVYLMCKSTIFMDLYLERNGVKYPYDERKVITKLIDDMISSGERQAIN